VPGRTAGGNRRQKQNAARIESGGSAERPILVHAEEAHAPRRDELLLFVADPRFSHLAGAAAGGRPGQTVQLSRAQRADGRRMRRRSASRIAPRCVDRFDAMRWID